MKKTAAIPPNTLRFCITSDIVDRDGDLVIPSGGQWVEYMANPVVLWAHQFYQLPVAKCVGIGRDDHAVYADFQFAVEEHEFAAQVYRLYDGGYLNAVSIGFQVLEAGPPDYQTIKARPDPERRCRRVIRRWNLLEVSCVPIGSNPEALRKAVAAGLVTSKSLLGSLAAEIGAQALRDVVRKSLGWGTARIDRLTPQELASLVNAIGAEPPQIKGSAVPLQLATTDSISEDIARGIRAGIPKVVQEAVAKSMELFK